ncbi:uncharacterized protein BDFB_000895 [Asbolus verrucosus]|uniref:E3 ubiquitin-protein ligase sinah n=1 Tax=Asbolus verrucosus TaxID=1661398 RepID=A0A482W7S4_ASBVE|nr:uncharacterized protein BDFB_000895 [Asbolus verrucosus]
MLSDTDVENHYNPDIRLIDIKRNGSNCGFQLTRGKWDPYPWVSSVDSGTAADSAGLRPGDCLLEVNGEDIIGRRITEVAEIVKSKPNQVSLLLWNAGVDPQCTPEAVCCGPMPINLQRLSACMATILAFLECPVCLDTIPPPTHQCENGHLICIRCRTKSERCPVCRLKFTRGRSLLSDQVYNALVDAFNLREEPIETRTAKMQQIFKIKNKNKNIPDIKITASHTNKFLARIVGKSTSVDNLADQNLSINKFNLMTKSLSTQEIFESESPVMSRTSSATRLSRNDKDKNHLSPNFRPTSCHGSFESLHKKSEDTPSEEVILFHCPFSSSCSSLIKGKTVIEHFQLIHDGPLIQYFKPNIKINFTKILERKDLCYLILIATNTFFVKIELGHINETSKTDDVLIWAWIMDTKTVSKEYDMQVKVTCRENHEVIISVQNSVCSLNRISYRDIKEFKKGVLFNTKTITSLNSPSDDFIIDISILKSTDV